MAQEMDLEDIRDLARKLSGRLSANDLPDEDLDVYINRFYQNFMPGILGVQEFDSWFTFTLTIDDGDYNLDTGVSGGLNVHSILPPISVAGVQISENRIYTDPEKFYELWPLSGDPYASGDVQDILILGRNLTFRPPPDSVDAVKFLDKRTIPTALALAGDYPTDRRWGILIGAGAAKLILDDNEEDTTKAVEICNEQITLFGRETMQMKQRYGTSKREL